MKEQDFLDIIKSYTGSKYIGDDCAYIKDFGIVVSQDSLIEDVHFSMKYITPYQLGYKSGKVNISDILASGGNCRYMSVALSLPKNTNNEFIKEFYSGLKDAIGDVEIIGGDITGSNKIMISITVLGDDKERKISSRKNAKTGYAVVTNGFYGSSAGGLKLLSKNKNMPEKLIKAHIMPEISYKFSENIAANIKDDYAMMDTSDGLADALFKVAVESNKTIIVDFSKIKYEKELKETFPEQYKDMILYGGEDYNLIAFIPQDFAKKYGFDVIGYVKEKDNVPVKIINYNDAETKEINNLNNCFNHF